MVRIKRYHPGILHIVRYQLIYNTVRPSVHRTELDNPSFDADSVQRTHLDPSDFSVYFGGSNQY